MSELILHIPPGRAWGTPHMSPFCAKLETYLRMTETPHKVVAASMQKAPKGKIPNVTIDGELMGDSQLIIERLEKTAKQPLDGDLSARDRATGRAIRRMIEEGTYFIGVHLRWTSDEGWPHTRKEMATIIPAPLRPLLPTPGSGRATSSMQDRQPPSARPWTTDSSIAAWDSSPTG